MSPVVFMDKRVANAIRRRAEACAVEDGGALIGMPDTGDVIAALFAPDDASRSHSHISFRGKDWEHELQRICAEQPGAGWIGYVHSHLGLDSLSSGDHAQLARLHDDPRIPACGVLAVLSIKNGSQFPRLRGWLSKSRNVLVEVDLYEVDDPRAARKHAHANQLKSPKLDRHLLGADHEVERFESELRALEDAGYTIHVQVVARGVEVALCHKETRGRLILTLPAEGWTGKPLVVLEQNGVRGDPVFAPLASIFSSWSSAIGLVDLVRYARGRGVWPRNLKTVEKTKDGGGQ